MACRLDDSFMPRRVSAEPLSVKFQPGDIASLVPSAIMQLTTRRTEPALGCRGISNGTSGRTPINPACARKHPNCRVFARGSAHTPDQGGDVSPMCENIDHTYSGPFERNYRMWGPISDPRQGQPGGSQVGWCWWHCKFGVQLCFAIVCSWSLNSIDRGCLRQ